MKKLKLAEIEAIKENLNEYIYGGELFRPVFNLKDVHALADLALKAIETLKFYGDEENWVNLTSVISEHSYVSCSTFTPDDYSEYSKHNVRRKGQRARQTLELVEDE
jgi:hypothetical protein